MLGSANVLVSGCSRGLGLEMVSQLIRRYPGPGIVVATCRSQDQLNQLRRHVGPGADSERLQTIVLNVDDLDSFGRFKEEVESRLLSVGKVGLDVLINNAGVAPKSTRINLVTADQMSSTFHTNVMAPLFLTRTLQPLLSAGKESTCPALVINMSSILGSISENTRQGGLYPYRASKAALNAVTRSMSIDLKHNHVAAVALHPGWVRTDMGGQNAPLSPEESVDGILKFIENFRPQLHNGNFFDYSGEPVAW